MSIPNIDFFGKLITFIGLAIAVISGLFIYTEYGKAKAMSQQLSKDALIINSNSAKKISADSIYTNQIKQRSVQLSNLITELKEKKADVEYVKNKANHLNKEIDSTHRAYESNRLTLTRSLDTLNTNYDVEKEIYLAKMSDYTSEIRNAFLTLIIGLLVSFLGIAIRQKKEEFEKEIVLRQNIDKPTYSKSCQSCGQIFDSIVIPGSDINGNKNYHFCQECYCNGVFSNPTMTLAQMESKIKSELLLNRQSEKLIKKATNKLRKLDRWKLNRYINSNA